MTTLFLIIFTLVCAAGVTAITSMCILSGRISREEEERAHDKSG